MLTSRREADNLQTMNFKTYLVGGAVRDELLGIPCKDLDYVVMAPSFAAMRQGLLDDGCTIFVEKEQFLTIRAKHPKLGYVDFSCARKDGNYTDGRRPDSVAVAETLEQDLARRDFTCNAIAKSVEHGRLLDPHKGQEDIANRVLCAVGNAEARLSEDKLRAFRALRFAVTKGFVMDYPLTQAIRKLSLSSDFQNVSTERIREELAKMFRKDSSASFFLLHQYCVLEQVVQERGIWFKPTTES